MALSAKLQLRQKQGLALTPQLLQSIKLLQMNATDLTRYIQEEVEKNPILELGAHSDGLPQERREAQSVSAIENNPTKNQSDFDRSTISTASNLGISSDIENRVAAELTMVEALNRQSAITSRTIIESDIAAQIINSLDDDGYLRRNTQEICSALDCSEILFNKVLAEIQLFEPPGIAARNLSECMQIQLREKNRLDPAMLLLTQNLDLLAKRDFEKLINICSVDHDDLVDMVKEIQDLEPRPGQIFDTTPVQNVVADVSVKSDNQGGWQIELNSQTLPKVLVNREYYAEIKQMALGKDDRKFMVDNLQNANWLVASLDQRAQTILKVATEIVRQQDAFFAGGAEYLKPLVLNTIAEEIKMHESTVSRVVANKYLNCESGLFPFKYFFMSGLPSGNGNEAIGGKSVRLKIKKLIEAETLDTVLSDANIAEKLALENIEIARRTVMKYRESMDIASSVQRRRSLKLRQ